MEQIMGWIIAGAPSLLTGVVLAKLKRKEEKDDEREKDRDEREELILEALGANFGITKEMVECMLYGKTPNGELEEAFKYKQNVKHKLEEYMRKKAARQ